MGYARSRFAVAMASATATALPAAPSAYANDAEDRANCWHKNICVGPGSGAFEFTLLFNSNFMGPWRNIGYNVGSPRPLTFWMTQAKGTLIGDCMMKAGYGQWHPTPELPTVGSKTLTDWRCGIHDRRLAQSRGYRAKAREQGAHHTARNVGAVDGTSALGPDGQALQDCRGEVRAPLKEDFDAYGEEAQMLGNETLLRSEEEPAGESAFAVWSSFMKEKGYTHEQPLDAGDDLRSGSLDVLPDEITTAVAAIACRDSTHVSKIWWEAETRLQAASLERRVFEQVPQGRGHCGEDCGRRPRGQAIGASAAAACYSAPSGPSLRGPPMDPRARPHAARHRPRSRPCHRALGRPLPRLASLANPTRGSPPPMSRPAHRSAMPT